MSASEKVDRRPQTDCRHRAIQNARSIPDVNISNLTVSNVASISMFAAPVPGQDPTVATDSFKAVESPSDGLQPAFAS